MKRLILVLELGLVLFVGCGSDSYPTQQQPAFYNNPAFWYGLNRGVNDAIRLDIEAQRANPPQIFYPKQNTWPPSNYWQEEWARQQWWDNRYRKMGVPSH